MIFELALGIGATIVLLAFFCEYIDSTLGMGYGTALTPLLLLIGFSPLQVVPAVLLSELVTGVLAGFTHHRAGNVNFKPRSMNIFYISKKIKEIGYIESFKRGVPTHLKIALVLAFCSIFGTLAAVLIAINISKFLLNMYIGILVFSIGIFILVTMNKNYGFSWRKILGIGMIASFNKGISGGGYGPLVTGGQILSGVKGKSAVGITSLAEGLTCLVGVLAYFVTRSVVDWRLAPYLVMGGILSVPLSAISVKKIQTKKLTLAIGIVAILLGGWTILKTIM